MALSCTVVGTLIQLSQTPTTHDTNTRVKLTIFTILSFRERLAIANLSLKPPHVIESIPSLSGHVITYRWRSLPRVRRDKASSPRGSSSNGCYLCITIDPLMWAIFSPTPTISIKWARLKYRGVWVVSKHNNVRGSEMFARGITIISITPSCRREANMGHRSKIRQAPKLLGRKSRGRLNRACYRSRPLCRHQLGQRQAHGWAQSNALVSPGYIWGLGSCTCRWPSCCCWLSYCRRSSCCYRGCCPTRSVPSSMLTFMKLSGAVASENVPAFFLSPICWRFSTDDGVGLIRLSYVRSWLNHGL